MKGGESGIDEPDFPPRRLQAVPLYEQVKRELSELILSGAWPRGAQIPGEEQLAGRFGVSVGTARRALGELVGEGLLARRRRHGTVVTERSPHHSMRFLYHYYRLHRETGELVLSRARVLSVETGVAGEEEKQRLRLSGGDNRVVRVHRVRSVESRPVMHERVALPAHRFPRFPGPEELPNRMYVFFHDRYGIRLAFARESLRADIANSEDRRLLGLAPGQALLEIDQISYDTMNSVVEWRVGRTVTEGYRYINEVR